MCVSLLHMPALLGCWQVVSLLLLSATYAMDAALPWLSVASLLLYVGCYQVSEAAPRSDPHHLIWCDAACCWVRLPALHGSHRPPHAGEGRAL